MSMRNRIRMAASTVYVIALIIGIFVGGFVWIAIIGAVALGGVYTTLRGGVLSGAPTGGRQRNRNRNRDRSQP